MYLKYTGWGFSLGILLALAWYGGEQLDAYFELSKPFLTISLMFVVLIAQFYTLIKDLS